MSAKESKESKTFKVFHAKIEIDMDLKDGETLEEAKKSHEKRVKENRFNKKQQEFPTSKRSESGGMNCIQKQE